jgi:hypothetical protein
MSKRLVTIGRAVADAGLGLSAYDVLTIADSVDSALVSESSPPAFILPHDLIDLENLARALAPVIDGVRRGRKIQAIKEYRMVTGLGLKDSKDAVEAIARVVPADLVPPVPQPWHGISYPYPDHFVEQDYDEPPF